VTLSTTKVVIPLQSVRIFFSEIVLKHSNIRCISHLKTLLMSKTAAP